MDNGMKINLKAPLHTPKRKQLTSCGMIDPFVLLYLSGD